MSELEKLAQIPLFSELDEQELAGVLSLMSYEEYSPGQTIIYEGDVANDFHVITAGTVEFITCDAAERDIVLDEASEGGFFGELSMLSGEKRTIRVRAKTAVSTLSLDREEFHDFLLKHPHAAIDVMTVLGRRLYQTDSRLRQSVSKNVNAIDDERLTFGQRIADAFATLMGSWPFIIVQSVLLIFWVTLNIIGWQHSWDPYPFILLNLALSFQAAYAAPIIMMSQNRQSDKDRLAAEIDHQVNIKAEVKTSLIMSRLDDIERGMHFLHDKLLEHMKATSR